MVGGLGGGGVGGGDVEVEEIGSAAAAVVVWAVVMVVVGVCVGEVAEEGGVEPIWGGLKWVVGLRGLGVRVGLVGLKWLVLLLGLVCEVVERKVLLGEVVVVRHDR